jgi:hypothetical protein
MPANWPIPTAWPCSCCGRPSRACASSSSASRTRGLRQAEPVRPGSGPAHHAQGYCGTPRCTPAGPDWASGMRQAYSHPYPQQRGLHESVVPFPDTGAAVRFPRGGAGPVRQRPRALAIALAASLSRLRTGAAGRLGNPRPAGLVGPPGRSAGARWSPHGDRGAQLRLPDHRASHGAALQAASEGSAHPIVAACWWRRPIRSSSA